MKSSTRKLLAGSVLLLGSAAACAHPGHDGLSFAAGLAHPFGADHLLAMVAVGLWSVFALPAGRAWMGPATFMGSLAASAALGVAGFTLPGLEHAIALSVVVFGLMLVMAARRLPVAPGLSVVALAAALHGLAHGAEAPAAGAFVPYAAGFMLTTAVLHFSGVFTGLALRRGLPAQAGAALSALGAGVGMAGAFLLTQA